MDLDKIALEIMEKACETDEIREDLDLDLFETGLIDSLSKINLILFMEETLNIRLQPTDLEKEDISTVNHFKDFLKKKVK